MEDVDVPKDCPARTTQHGLQDRSKKFSQIYDHSLEFFGVFIDRYGSDSTAQATLNLLWTARVLGGDPRPDDDVDELRWFGPDELPADDELAFRPNVAKALSAWRAGQKHP